MRRGVVGCDKVAVTHPTMARAHTKELLSKIKDEKSNSRRKSFIVKKSVFSRTQIEVIFHIVIVPEKLIYIMIQALCLDNIPQE
jgi:hypothetical protein